MTAVMQKVEVELILTRHLADCLAMPIGIIGVDGRVLYYNEPAANIAGMPFREGLELDTLPAMFQMSHADGSPLLAEEMVTTIALKERRPGHQRLRMRGIDGEWRDVEATAFPLEGQGGRLLGAVTIFWKAGERLTPDGATGRSRVEGNVELILARQIASYLVMPIWVIGLDGNVIYYNEPAEVIVARPFEEAGPMPLEELAATFQTTAEDGSLLDTNALPITIALKRGQPAHLPMRIRGLDGLWRRIEVTSFPLEGQDGRMLGVVSLFWEEGPE
jgi:PAS domain-containing protein